MDLLWRFSGEEKQLISPAAWAAVGLAVRAERHDCPVERC
jgi:hypothetical protein